MWQKWVEKYSPSGGAGSVANTMIRPRATLLFFAAVLVFVAGCGQNPSTEQAPVTPVSDQPGAVVSESININTAPSEELKRLPHIGDAMAEKIVDFRQKHGPFKRPEELMLVDGISDERFRRIRPLIRVE